MGWRNKHCSSRAAASTCTAEEHAAVPVEDEGTANINKIQDLFLI